MEPFKYLQLLFLLLLISCTGNNSEIDSVHLANQAQEKFQAALQAEKQGDFWQSISLYNESNQLYSLADSAELIQYQYLLHRFKGKMLAKVGLPAEAVKSLYTALEYLEKAPIIELGNNTSRSVHEIGTRRYIGSYLSSNGQYLESNALFTDLLKKTAKSADLNAEFKNLIGLNFLALQDHESAYRIFTDLLKNENIKPRLKAYYLDSWAVAAYRVGHIDEAFSGLNEAIGIDQALNQSQAEMEHRTNLGELYLLEKKYELANTQLEKALAAYPTPGQDPGLYKVYNLKYTAASVLGYSDANKFKLKYDSLLIENQKARQVYSAEQQLAILTAQMDKLQIDDQRTYWQDQIKLFSSLSLVLIVVFVMAVLFTWLLIKRARSIKTRATTLSTERLS